MAIASTISLSAQLNVFNHIGADVSVGTTGIGIELSSPITDFVDVRAGVSFMPGIHFNANFNATAEILSNSSLGSPQVSADKFDMQLQGSLARTQGDIIFNVYPFGKVNNFYVAAGAYFGGKSIIKLDGHSDKIAQLQDEGVLQAGYVEVGDYKLNFEENGHIRGGLCANTFRPYLGLGYGRACPGSRVGFSVVAGVQFMGHMKVCQGKNLDPIDLSDLNNDDDWKKWMDKLTVYPVVRVTLTGLIL